MNEKNNGGPAFPTGSGVAAYSSGMTLRDYFAAKAMVQIMDDTKDEPEFTYADAAMYAYRVADAMLQARVNTNA